MRKRTFHIGLVVVVALGWAFLSNPVAAEQAKSAGKAEGRAPVRQARESKTRDIKRLKDKTIVSRALADRIKQDNTLVLSTVAVKAVVLKNKDSAFKLVQIDKGGLAEKMGFREGDVICKVNGLEMKTAADQSAMLEKCDRFKVLLLRGGKEKVLRFQIE